MLKKLLIAMLICFCSITTLFAAGQQEAESKDDAVKLVVYGNGGFMRARLRSISTTDEMKSAMHDWILENTGYSVEVLAPGTSSDQDTQKINLLLASGSQLDGFWGDWPDYYAQGAIQPLTEHFKTVGPNILPAWPKSSVDALTHEGEIWGIPRVTPMMSSPTFFRTDWLEELGMDMPETIDDMTAYFKAVKEAKPAGDRTVPLLLNTSGIHGAVPMYDGLLGAFTEYGYSNWMDKDGMLKPYILQPGVKDYVVQLNEWFEDGYIYPEFASLDQNKIRDLISSAVVGATISTSTDTTATDAEQRKINPECNFALNPAGIKGPMGLAETATPSGYQAQLVPASSKHPEGIVAIQDFLYQDPANFLMSLYGPGNWEWDESKGGRDAVAFTGEYKDYAGDFGWSVSLAAWVGIGLINDREDQNYKQHHYFGISGLGRTPPDVTNTDRGKLPQDAYVLYDQSVLEEEVPGLADLQRMMDEEVFKFIIGSRPISEWDSFMNELYSAGMDDWIKAHTKMYLEQRG